MMTASEKDQGQDRQDLRGFLERDVLPRLTVEAVYAGVRFTSTRGRYWRAACPLHGGDNETAFSVDTETLGWRCYTRCGSGSAIAFVNGGAPPTGRAFVEAVRTLAERAGVAFPEREPAPEERARSEAARRRDALLETFLAYAREMLLNGEGVAARAYLVARGFPKERLGSLGFGVYTDPIDVELRLLDAGFTAEEIEDAGLVSPAWSGRLVGPWRDRWGRLGTLYARDLTGTAGAGHKYLYLRGVSKRDLVALGLDAALKTAAGRRDLVLVEGLLDVALLQALGFPNVAALGGSGHELSADRLEALARFGVRRVTLAFDNDAAGREGTLAALDNAVAATAAPDIYVVDPATLGEAKDPDELVRRRGLAAFEAALERRLPANVYYGRALLGDVTPESAEYGRRGAIERVLEYLGRLSEPRAALDRQDVLAYAAARTGYEPRELAVLVDERIRERRRAEIERALDRALREAVAARREGTDVAVVVATLAEAVTRLRAELAALPI